MSIHMPSYALNVVVLIVTPTGVGHWVLLDKGGDNMYTKKFFMAALIFLFIVITLVCFTNEDLNKIATYHNNEPFAMCVIRLITEIVSGELVVSEDGKYLQYREKKEEVVSNE